MLMVQRDFTYVCKLCGESKSSLVPVPDELCDGCWELKVRVEAQPELARKILMSIDVLGEVAR